MVLIFTLNGSPVTHIPCPVPHTHTLEKKSGFRERFPLKFRHVKGG